MALVLGVQKTAAMAEQWEYAEIRFDGTRWQPNIPGRLPADDGKVVLFELLNELAPERWEIVGQYATDVVTIRRPKPSDPG